MDITFLYYVSGIVVCIVLFLRVQSRIDAINSEKEIDVKVDEYIQNNSKFVKIEHIEENATYIAYNYLTDDFITQGSTEAEVKSNLALKWPKFDIFVIKVESQV